MELSNEKTEEYCTFDLDISEEEEKFLYEYGLEKIRDDRGEVINYAVNVLIKDFLGNYKETDNVNKE